MKRRRNKRYLLITLCVLALVAIALYLRPIPLVKPTVVQPSAQPLVLQPVDLPWPSTGQAAVGAVNYGVLAAHNAGHAVPMASTAKVLTALAVLDKKPLQPGQQGPQITISGDDVAYYQDAYGLGQSVLPVYEGEKLSEYQALQALLIPSANNIAYSLAVWAFGSMDNYLSYANQKAQDFGMINTHFADASGFSPQTISTADDLVKLGLAGMKNPLITSVVGQSTATLPGAGPVKNVNWLLGDEGIIGIKTGNTDQAGGVFLLAANRTINSQPVTVITAVMQTPDLLSAMTSSKNLLMASDNGFSIKNVPFIANYIPPWGGISQAEAAIPVLVWQSSALKQTSTLKDLPAGSQAGALGGTVTVKNADYTKTAAVKLNNEIKKPSVWWRIFHI